MAAFGFASRSDLERELERFATKEDLRVVEGRLEQRIEQTEHRLRDEIHNVQTSTTRWIVGLGLALVAVIAALYGPMLAVLLQILARLPLPPAS